MLNSKPTALGFLRLFLDVTFQSTFAVMLSFVLVLLAGPGVIRWLRSKKIGDLAKFDQEQNEQAHGGESVALPPWAAFLSSAQSSSRSFF